MHGESRSRMISVVRTAYMRTLQAYNILCDGSAAHQSNQRKLRDSEVLSGTRLGSCLWRTRGEQTRHVDV